MKQTEIIKLIGLCSVNYRNWPEEDKLEMLITLWCQMLDDVTFEIAQVAVQKHMSESVYPPTIADIRAKISDITRPNVMHSMEAWGSVVRSIRLYGSYNEKKAMDSLEPLTRKVVELIGFRNLCMSENEMADRAHFTKAYDSLVERERKESLVPLAGREVMKKLQLQNAVKKLS